MNKKLIFSVMLVCCLLVFVAVVAFSQNDQSVRWEYRTLIVNYKSFDEEANKLGAQGWELVVMGATTRNASVYMFKRRLP